MSMTLISKHEEGTSEVRVELSKDRTRLEVSVLDRTLSASDAIPQTARLDRGEAENLLSILESYLGRVEPTESTIEDTNHPWRQL